MMRSCSEAAKTKILQFHLQMYFILHLHLNPQSGDSFLQFFRHDSGDPASLSRQGRDQDLHRSSFQQVKLHGILRLVPVDSGV